MDKPIRFFFFKSIALLLTAALSMGIFWLSYRYDNKYQTDSLQPIGGILYLSGETLTAGPLYLINGWEYYGGRLLTPEEASAPDTLPDRYTAIGQFGGMEAGNSARPPHGSATYRLNIILPEEPDTYCLELPEIFSAYRLYIDGREIRSMGNPDPDAYEPSIRMDKVTFTAGGGTELLFAVSDQSHFYSGMVYPPAFGTRAAISDLLTQRFAWYLIMVSLASLLGIYEFVLSLIRKSRRSFLFSLLCLSVAVSISSPVLHSLSATSVWPWYGVETFCRYAGFGLALLLVNRLCHLKGRLSHISAAIACGFPPLMFVVYSAASLLSYRQMAVISILASLYKWFCALWILGTSLLSSRQQERGGFLLACGTVILAVSLAANRLFPMFEPIRFGWFSELAWFFFLLVLAARLWMDTADAYRRQGVLEEEKRRLGQMLTLQKSYYEAIAGQVAETQALRHDLRHHLHTIRNLLSGSDKKKAAEYIDSLAGTPALTTPIRFCEVPAVDAVLKYYYQKSVELGIHVSFEFQLPNPLFIQEQDFCVVLGNLMENAVEACTSRSNGGAAAAEPETDRSLPVNSYIRLSVTFRHDNLLIELHNSSFLPELSASIPGGCSGRRQRIEDGFPSTKVPGRTGIGLASVKAVAVKYGGEVWVNTVSNSDGSREFITKVFLLNREGGNQP